jgi:iron only hydrogenase large subunit-like protein
MAKCNGCTNCVKGCPTDAIRVKNRKARIKDEKCIDCGVCIRLCEKNANYALTDSLAKLDDYKYNIVLPTSVLYGQFKQKYSPTKILSALLELGFDDVWEVGIGVDILNTILPDFLENQGISPLISSTCPSIVRLIQVSFPDFLPNIIPLQEPLEIAARSIKERKMKELNLSSEEIGIFYITPCPAKITAINNPLGIQNSYIDGAISVADIYRLLVRVINEVEVNPKLQKTSREGISWAKCGGQSESYRKFRSSLAVDGIDNVISILEALERGSLREIEFFEFAACPGGCVGGPLNVENRFISQVVLEEISYQLPKDNPNQILKNREIFNDYKDGKYNTFKLLKPRFFDRLDSDIKKAINKLDKVGKVESELPGLNCTACGAPSCSALAEDIVNDLAEKEDCVIIFKNKMQKLAHEIIDLTEKKEV